MELRDVVRGRHMVRSYVPDRPVPPELVTRALDHASRAPSAGFTQGWDFVVLTSAEDRALFWATTTDPHGEPDAWLAHMRQAPVLILCLSDPQRYLDRYAEPDKGWEDRDPARWPIPYWDVDTGMAALLLLLTAVDEGLGACFFGVPAEDHARVLTTFAAPEHLRVVGVVSLGYAAPEDRGSSARRGRRPLGDVAHDGRYGQPWTAPPPGR